MAELAAPLVVEKIVKPRKPANEQVQIITCDQRSVCRYEGMPGIEWDPAGLINYLRRYWPQSKDKRRLKMLWVCHSPEKVLLELEKEFGNDPEWNARFTVQEGESQDDNGCTFYRKESKRVVYFGFRDSRRHCRYFYPVSTAEFFKSLKGYGNAADEEHQKLLQFGSELRRVCEGNLLRISGSRGGISGQLLRDQKFYPRPRRKVPTRTNEAARVALPGNCYQMVERKIDRFYQSVYIIDQQNAHHYAAETVSLPHANELFAYGWYFNQSDAEWVNYRDSLFEDALNEHGLFRVRVSVPQHHHGYVPPWMRAFGDRVGGTTLTDIWLYSNEIAFAKSLGVQIRHISRWYGSPSVDEGIKRYAQWSRNQVDSSPNAKPWLKPTLLSAYGILGAKPRYLESAYKRSKGKPHTYLFGPQPIEYTQVKSSKKIQSPVANVIQRGMIEAETRKLSIELARKLEREDHNVIGIHADAVLVENTGQQLPLLDPPWRVKDCLTRFRALDAVSFESDELEILPGRPVSKRKQKTKVK